MSRTAAGILVALALAAFAIAGTVPTALGLVGKGAVVGGIEPCDPLGVSSLRYAAGNVYVFPGQAPAEPSAAQAVSVAFSGGVAAQHVDDNGTYLFILDSGTYTLVSSNEFLVPSWVGVTVHRGTVTRVDIPDRCI